MFSEVFFSLVLTSGIGLLLSLARMCYKSKCKTIRCCGLEIDRDVEVEEKEDELEIEMRNNKSFDERRD